MDPCPTILSVEQCKHLLTLIAKKHCVRASLISTRLLSSDDKQDMLNGEIPMESLENHVEVWKEGGMSDLSNGKTRRFNEFYDILCR